MDAQPASKLANPIMRQRRSIFIRAESRGSRKYLPMFREARVSGDLKSLRESIPREIARSSPKVSLPKHVVQARGTELRKKHHYLQSKTDTSHLIQPWYALLPRHLLANQI